MYVDYYTPQFPVDGSHRKSQRAAGDYRPSWLIRTSDWQKVPGSEAKEGYCALSYCWEQSGDIIRKDDGTYDCIDNPENQVQHVVPFSPFLFTKKPKVWSVQKVNYEGVLQQICKDFKVPYLWYDKVCIDQTNKEEKHREIKQMHRIYSNACYTVAFVPEVKALHARDFVRRDWDQLGTRAEVTGFSQVHSSHWWKRSWTLEEMVMSTDILIVGTNTHMWCVEDLSVNAFKLRPSTYPAPSLKHYNARTSKSVNEILRYAHTRTSTKEHDKVFALANTFHDFVSIEVDYGCDWSTLMRTFYRQLAEYSLSTMCFGSYCAMDNLGPVFFGGGTSTMNTYGLPTWTGANGLHAATPVAGVALDQNDSYYIDDSMHLHITCRYYAVRPTAYNDYMFRAEEKRRRTVESYSSKQVTSMDDFDGCEQTALDWSQGLMADGLGCAPTHYWKTNHPAFGSPILSFSLIEELNDECIIPAVLIDAYRESYNTSNLFTKLEENSGRDKSWNYFVAPVLKKSTETELYKAIGTVLLVHYISSKTPPDPHTYLDDLFSELCTETKEFTIE